MSPIDESPGVFTFMVGLIIVVMGGVGLSLMVDRHFSFSRSAVCLEREIESGSEALERLGFLYKETASRLSGIEPNRSDNARIYEATKNELVCLGRRRAELLEELAFVRKEVSGIDETFTRYRRDYRDGIWAEAVGESLGDLKVRGGREYRQVVITRVSDVGLEIRHEQGIARLHAPDLTGPLQSRFQWIDEERRIRLTKEFAALEAMSLPSVGAIGSRPAKRVATRKRSGDGLQDAAELAILRERVSALEVKVSRLGADRNEAYDSAVAKGSGSSVPDGLETWHARSMRLGAALAAARAELAAARYDVSAWLRHNRFQSGGVGHR